jgi:hypothetical protein
MRAAHKRLLCTYVYTDHNLGAGPNYHLIGGGFTLKMYHCHNILLQLLSDGVIDIVARIELVVYESCHSRN